MPPGGGAGAGAGAMLQVPGQKEDKQNGIEMAAKKKPAIDKTPLLSKDNKVAPGDAPDIQVEVKEGESGRGIGRRRREREKAE